LYGAKVIILFLSRPFYEKDAFCGMKIKLIFTGKTNEAHVAHGLDMYLQRLKHYCKFELMELDDLKQTKNLNQEQVKEKEAHKQLSALATQDKLILLDENGKSLSSRGFAEFIEKEQSNGQYDLAFLIGGPYGFHSSVHARASMKLSFSAFTFPHQLIRIMLAEQLYRAYSIIKNEPYHHD